MKQGDYRQLGARICDGFVTFAFTVRDIDDAPSICVYKKDSFELVKKIVPTQKDRAGRSYFVKAKGIDAKNCCYLYEINGKLYMDPYATSVVGREIWNDKSRFEKDLVVYAGFDDLSEDFDDVKPQIAPKDMIIYQANLRGFTMNHSLSDKLKGNYRGFIKRLSYIRDLGCTSVELMPVYDFEEVFSECRQVIDKEGHCSFVLSDVDKVNYWGYGDACYFAPKASYFGENPVKGLRELVGAIHKEGMEVILDFNFPETTSADLIIDVLEYYAVNYHVDGLRIIGQNCPMERISADPLLSEAKIFYEGISGEILENESHKHLFLYNDGFMCVLRQMLNHMNGSLVQLTNHMRRQNENYGFVNYAAVNNGFTLMDSFSYGEKHNAANGEENRDGNNQNFSANYGVEGATRNKSILAMRNLQARNALFATLLSQGIPMLLSGDERGNSALGNNNPYCQDNETGWVSFAKKKDAVSLCEFTKKLIDFRKNHGCIRQENAFLMNDYRHVGLPDMSYHGSMPWIMSVAEEQKAIGILFCGEYAEEEEDVYLCYNFSYNEVELALPRISSPKRWRAAISTVEFENDLTPKPIDNQQSVKLAPQSCLALVGVKI